MITAVKAEGRTFPMHLDDNSCLPNSIIPHSIIHPSKPQSHSDCLAIYLFTSIDQSMDHPQPLPPSPLVLRQHPARIGFNREGWEQAAVSRCINVKQGSIGVRDQRRREMLMMKGCSDREVELPLVNDPTLPRPHDDSHLLYLVNPYTNAFLTFILHSAQRSSHQLTTSCLSYILRYDLTHQARCRCSMSTQMPWLTPELLGQLGG
jgi:hypothetical protein